MAQFAPAFEFLLSHEGTKLYRNERTGEVSRYGITLKLAGALGECAPEDEAFIVDMTRDRARVFYRNHFWNCTLLPHVADQAVANKFLDMAVHMGLGQATKLFQRACNDVVPEAPLADDGLFGPRTLARANSLASDALLKEVRERQAGFYRLLALKHPETAENLDGWLVRAAA